MTATDWAAWVGALGTFGLTAFEIFKSVNDRVKLKVRISSGLEIVGSDEYGRMIKIDTHKTFWTVDVSNIGRQPVIINQLVVGRNDTDVYSMLTRDYNGTISRYTLIPGDSHTYTITDDLIPYNKVKMVIISDAVGNNYKEVIKHH